MYKKASILSYFKPFTQAPPLNKRSLPEDCSEEERAIRRSRSATPEECQPKKSHVRQREHPGQGVHQKTSRVASKSSNRHSPSPQDEGPTDSATPAQAFRDNSHSPLPPLLSDPILRDLDVLGSQSTRLTSSQRVVRNGDVVIRNSDGESDSGSDSSLEDLNHLLLPEGRRTQREPSRPESQTPTSSLNNDGHPMSTRRRTKTDAAATLFGSAFAVQPKKYKFDLESLARQRKQEEASIEDITRASVMLRSFEQQKASVSGNAAATSTTRPFDARLIDIAMNEHGDEDELSRLKVAIQRTEALHLGKAWSFFDEQSSGPLLEQLAFPIIEDDRLGRMLGKTVSRQQAFLSGYVGEFAMKEGLSEEILLWIMDAICLESRDDLRCSYTATLTDASNHLASVLSPERIDMLFRKLGATTAALDTKGPVTPQLALSQSIEPVNRPNLSSIIDLFHKVASVLSAETRIHLICTLCRLVLDRSIANSCHIIRSIEDAFASLIESVPEQDLDHDLQIVMTTAFKSITDTTLRLRLLQNILASSHRLVSLRRRLALAFFYRDIGYLSQAGDDRIDLRSIARHLEGPQFIISNATDYSELAAAIGILGIAIDCGDPPSSPCAKEEERAFNREIDALSAKINSMFAEIVDTGASHMGRTEAKEVLEAFQYWLSYGVRTKPPPKKSLFGDSTFDGIASRHMMETFVGKGQQDKSVALLNNVRRQGNLGYSSSVENVGG